MVFQKYNCSRAGYGIKFVTVNGPYETNKNKQDFWSQNSEIPQDNVIQRKSKKKYKGNYWPLLDSLSFLKSGSNSEII